MDQYKCQTIQKKLNMLGEYRMIKPSFHINIEVHSEWHCPKFFRGKYSKNASLFDFKNSNLIASQPEIACSKLTTETLPQGVKYVQRHQKYVNIGSRMTPLTNAS